MGRLRKTTMENQITINKAIEIIKAVPYNDNVIEQWISNPTHIKEWIKGAEMMKKKVKEANSLGISLEEMVEAYEVEYRKIADNQGVSINAYKPMFFLASEEIKNRFIANQFLKDMKVINF